MASRVLKFRTGIVIAIISGATSVIATWWLHPRPLLGVVAGCLLGAVGGSLQRRSLAEDPSAYISASSLSAVRKVMASTPSGKRYLYWQYAALLVLLVIGFGFSELGILEVAVGYMAFICTRELVTLGALLKLERATTIV